MTVKLYWEDSHLTDFQAQVAAVELLDGQPTLVLDRTAFYPIGGGQPCDTGTIEGVQVLDVVIAKDGLIHHCLSSTAGFNLGQTVSCQINVDRRREMTQQHTGQHILSQAFVQLFGAETRGFRINAQTSELDLALDFPAEELELALRQAESLANRIVFENRPIRTHLVSPEESTRFPLRKESFITDCVRIIEIADFDWSACGGTHATQTGEVGLIAIKGWQRAKKMARIEFLCGVRALRDYQQANATAEAIARKFSVAREDAVAAVERLMETNKQLTRRNRQLAEIAAETEAAAILASHSPQQGRQLLTKVFDDRSFEELKLLAHQLVKTPSVVALLALKEEKAVRLIFARGADVAIGMGALMQEACQLLGGKGGGTPEFAQGGGVNADILEGVLRLMAQKASS